MNEIRKVIALLSRAERRRFAWLTLVILIMGLLEVVGVASILPFMQMVAAPDVVEEDSPIYLLRKLFGPIERRSLILMSGAGVILLIALTNIFSIFATWLKFRTSWGLVHTLSCRLLGVYLQRPYEFFLTTSSSEITSYILAEVNGFANGVVLPMVEIISRLSVAGIIFALLLWVDVKIALIMFGSLSLSYVLIYLLQRRLLTRLGEQRIATNVARYQALREVFDGIKTVMVYNRMGFFYRYFSEASKKFNSLQPVYQVVTTAPRNVLEILAFGTIIGITIHLYLGSGNLDKVIPILSLYAVAGYRLLPALQKAFAAIGNYRHNFPVIGKFPEELARLADEDTVPAATPQPIAFNESIKLDKLSFSYENADRITIDNVDLKIEQGQTAAFIGSTGSGKTTLVDLLVGLLKPASGQILIDGTALNQETIPAWRAGIAYVPQEVFLFDDSVLANVVMGVVGADVDTGKAEEAMKLADILDFVKGLPQGIHTPIGEKGVRLSGGQRQRLGLARALYASPSVLILDEATSALDNVTERGIIDSLRALPRSITTIVIAHRLSTVQHADCIYLLEDGRLASQGTYDDLLNSSSAFREMALLA